jgi:hypothetical protein
MVLKVHGLTEKSKAKPLIGVTDTETVMLDFDNTPFKTVKYWAKRVMNRFKLTGFILLKSSEKNYHIVFDREVTWNENVSIMAWICLFFYGRNLSRFPLLRYFIMQYIKKDSTLRVSTKQQKPSPRIVFRFGKQDKQIKNFLKMKDLVKKIIKKL